MLDRRGFFKRGLQLSVLGGMLGGTAYLVNRNGLSDSCSENQLCRNCSKLKNCELEKAQAEKAVEARNVK